jgi:multiple sugar transport system ATP-binding protein
VAEIRLSQVRKVYEGQVTAVESFNLVIPDQELLVLVGPSGCGKSTVLRMIAGLEDLTEGELEIDGELVNDVPPRDRDVAMVFQSYALYPHLDVYENMAFGLRLRKFSREEIDVRVREAAGMLGILPYLERRPKALSGGQRQRVAIGRAIVRKPKVFLFDEPLSNLDAKMRVGMRTEIARLHQRLKATMVYVTHDQVEAMTLGNRIVVMDQGKVRQIGSPMELYNRPANDFVAGFLGTPPMNFLEVQVAPDGALILPGSGDPVFMDAARTQALRSTGTMDARFGIRSESLHVDRTGAKGWKALVDVVEPLGSESLVYCKLGKSQVVARVAPGNEPSPSDLVTLVPDPSRIHLFRLDDGMRIVGT